eukprot:Gb_27137 [translate_table: standard]
MQSLLEFESTRANSEENWRKNNEGCIAFHLWHLRNTLVLLNGVSGNISAFALFLAPVITFYKVYKKGSTEEFSGIPYVVTLLNCLLFAWYGLPFITSHNILVSTVNGSGAVLEFIYICLFLLYAPPKPRIKIFILFMGGLAFFIAVAVISLAALHHNARKLFVGVIAATFSASMYASPLSIMRLVIRTKSVEYMPFFLSFFGFLCSASWFLYGIFGNDPFVAAPNGIGAFLGAAQLVLYFIYKDSTPSKNGVVTGSGVGHEVVKPFSSNKQDVTSLEFGNVSLVPAILHMPPLKF